MIFTLTQKIILEILIKFSTRNPQKKNCFYIDRFIDRFND